MKPNERTNAETFGMIGAKMAPAIIARVEQLAAAEGIAKSAYVRRLVLRHLEALDAAKKGGVVA